MRSPSWARRRSPSTRRVPSSAAVLLAAVLAFPIPLARAADPAPPTELDVTWQDIVNRVSCMLSSLWDLGVKGLQVGGSKCGIYIRVDDPD
jgi:hypothetical protein